MEETDHRDGYESGSTEVFMDTSFGQIGTEARQKRMDGEEMWE